MILYGYIFALAYGIICLISAALFYKLGVPKIFTRKIVHILVGFEWVILYVFHGATVHFLIVCLLFLALLIVAAAKKLMPMISSDSDNSLGTVYYAVSMSVMSIACLFFKDLIIPFGIAVFCTSFGDGFAGVVGQAVKKFNPKIYQNKSIFGLLANLLFSAATVLIFNHLFDLKLGVIGLLSIVVFAAELELFTGRGFDNITLPLGVFGITNFVLYCSDSPNYLLPILLTPIIIAVVAKKKILSSAGIYVSIIVDFAISISLGNFGFTLLLLFLVLGVLTDKIKKSVVKKEDPNEVDHIRNHSQVIANSLVGTLMAICFLISKSKIFAVAFAASFAEALADTSSSSFGAFSKTTFDLFKMRKCKKGLSGGVSLYGTLAAIVSSAFMGAISVLFGFGFKDFLIITLSGFIGTIFDSFLGSVFQIKYKCEVCSEIIEKEEHCGEIGHRFSGFKFITNSVVNLLSTAFAAAVAILLFFM